MATFVYPAVTVDTTGLATEAKQDDIIAELQDVNTAVADVSTETTLSALNAKVTAVDTGDVTISSSALPTGAATESTLSTLNAKVTAVDTGDVTISSSALPTGAATESTISALNAKVTAVDTGDVTVSASALPTGAATEATVATLATESSLSALNAKVTAVDTGDVTVSASALPTGAATESTLSSLNAKVTAVDTGDVTISSSALPTGAATAASQASILAELQRIETKTPVDFLDSGLIDTSSTNIATAGTTVVASLASDVSELEVVEDIGEYMALTDGSDTILAYLPLGGGRVKISISSGTALKLASLTGSAISSGSIAINFLN